LLVVQRSTNRPWDRIIEVIEVQTATAFAPGDGSGGPWPGTALCEMALDGFEKLQETMVFTIKYRVFL
jgi:hypothetical protein